MKIQQLFLIVALLLLISSCKDAPFNTPDQKEYVVKWLENKQEYDNSSNNIIKDEIAEKTKKHFQNRSFSDWKGRVKKINNMSSYAQVVITQMINRKTPSTMTYLMDISKDSEAYNFLRNLSVGDTIVFSGTIETEISLTDWGMMDEPELKVNCTKIFGFKNVFNSKGSYSDNSNSENSMHECSICGKRFKGPGYEEVSHGNWKLCEEPYQCFVCSPACGKKHTSNWDEILEEVSGQEKCEYCYGGRINSKGFCGSCGLASKSKNRQIEQENSVSCQGCNGTGRRGSDICSLCNGKGSYRRY
jgi:hypothetical protein